MKLTIAYFTNRLQPHWQWFVDSLRNQTTEEETSDIEVVFIDGYAWADGIESRSGSRVHLAEAIDKERAADLDRTGIRTHFRNVVHLPPKPTPWQGPFRQTGQDYFAASNARNTALMVARGYYFVGVDDLSVLMPGWMDQVRHAANNLYAVCGAYRKDREMQVERGILIKSIPSSIDSRWDLGSSGGAVPAAGSWLYGCSFGMPLQTALKVNGFDEVCDGQGAEDYDFGIRAGRTGTPFYYNRNMLTVESEEGHLKTDILPRKAKAVIPACLPPSYSGDPMSDHVLINRLLNERHRIHTLATDDLQGQRDLYFKENIFLAPSKVTLDWRDGTPLSQY